MLDGDKAIGEALVFIERHLGEPLTAAMVAEAVSYSYYHFHRYFALVMGETIGGYLRGRRLTQAARELVHTSKKVIDIALELQFESPESFARAFKKRYGVTPREYRRNGVDVLIANHPPLGPADVVAVDGSQLVPEIVEVAPLRLAGLRFPMSVADNGSRAAWDDLNARLVAAYGGQEPRGDRYGFYEVDSGCSANTFDESSMATGFVGFEHKTTEELLGLSGLVEKRFLGGTYARFVHRGTVDNLLLTYRYLWGVWFPKSGLSLAPRDDFERYTSRFLGPANEDSEIEIYFPVDGV